MNSDSSTDTNDQEASGTETSSQEVTPIMNIHTTNNSSEPQTGMNVRTSSRFKKENNTDGSICTAEGKWPLRVLHQQTDKSMPITATNSTQKVQRNITSTEICASPESGLKHSSFEIEVKPRLT